MIAKVSATAALLLAAAQAGAVVQLGPVTTLDFEDLAAGTTLSNQYAAWGAIFSPNAFSGAGSSSSEVDWSTTTDMTIVDSATSGAETGLGSPALVSGHILHSFQAWLADGYGDPSFRISFVHPVTSISVDFAAVEEMYASDTRLFVYDGTTLLETVSGGAGGQFTLGYAADRITSVVVAPGSYNDWVGVDNVSYTVSAVPEPGSYALMALGVGALLLRRRVAR